MINLIVAWDENHLIGCKNGLPWKIPEELRLFNKKTDGCSVIMGARTFESLPNKPLKNRTNIVVSKKGYDKLNCLEYEFSYKTMIGPVYCVKSLDDGIMFAAKNKPNKEIFIIGGRQLYQTALEEGVVDRIYLSQIFGEYEGDVYFPYELLKGWDFNHVATHDEFDEFVLIKGKI
jgi:dihydrofolate reductase